MSPKRVPDVGEVLVTRDSRLLCVGKAEHDGVFVVDLNKTIELSNHGILAGEGKIERLPFGDREQGYIEGRRRTLLNTLLHALGDLQAMPPYPPVIPGSPESDEQKLSHALTKLASFASERHETVATLRRLCRDYGDNDWEDDLHLTDVVEKHLLNYLLAGKR